MQPGQWRPCMGRLDATQRDGRLDERHPVDPGQIADETVFEVTEICRNHTHQAVPSGSRWSQKVARVNPSGPR